MTPDTRRGGWSRGVAARRTRNQNTIKKVGNDMKIDPQDALSWLAVALIAITLTYPVLVIAGRAFRLGLGQC